MYDNCTASIERGLQVATSSALGLAYILTSITLGVIIYHRRRLKQHHIFSFNIILGDFIGALSWCIILPMLRYFDVSMVWIYAVKAQTSLAPLSRFHGSRVTTAHAHQCIFQSYAKTVPSRMKLTVKLTMRESASTTTDTWSRRVTFDINSVILMKSILFMYLKNVNCRQIIS